jgi:hypothetical protein
MPAPAPNWKVRDQPQGSYNDLVAVAAPYEIAIAADATASLKWDNLTRSVQIKATGLVYVGLSKVGAEGTNRFPVDDGEPLSEVLQTDALYIHNPGEDAVTVWVLAVLSDSTTDGSSLAFTAAEGFDGITTSVAVTNPEA